MSDSSMRPRLLARVDRDTEFLTGLIMALTFTCTLSVATAGSHNVRTVILGALGCNAAWGVVDAAMYLLSCLADRADDLATHVRLRGAHEPGAGRPLLKEALPQSVVAVLTPAELDDLGARIATLPLPAGHATLQRRDYLAALEILVTVFVSAVPVILPLALISDAGLALRISNATAIGLMFLFGRALGRATGIPRLRTEFAMVAFGVALVAITIALGG